MTKISNAIYTIIKKNFFQVVWDFSSASKSRQMSTAPDLWAIKLIFYLPTTIQKRKPSIVLQHFSQKKEKIKKKNSFFFNCFIAVQVSQKNIAEAIALETYNSHLGTFNLIYWLTSTSIFFHPEHGTSNIVKLVNFIAMESKITNEKAKYCRDKSRTVHKRNA